MSDDTVDKPLPKKARIRYALTSGEEKPKYHSTSMRPGTPWSESEDNPMSSNFLPLEQRGGLGRARFWAAHAKRKRGRTIAGQFDPKPKEA